MKISRVTVIVILFFLLIIKTYSQKLSGNKKEQQFLITCEKIVKAFINHDIHTINSYINPVTGFYLIYKPGARPSYAHLGKLIPDTLNFTFNNYYDKKISFYKLKISVPVEYDCDKGWDKQGNFIDISNKRKPVSENIKLWKSSGYEVEEKTKAELINIRKVEKNVRRIVFTKIGCCGMVFYMSFINDKWYLTILDEAEVNCDA